jgi:hypothetical protein
VLPDLRTRSDEVGAELLDLLLVLRLGDRLRVATTTGCDKSNYAGDHHE